MHKNKEENMKKVIKIILWVILGVVAAYVIFNRFDAREPVPAYSLKDIPPATFDKSNGYYQLLTLTYPEDADIQSEEVYLTFRHLFDPQFDNDKYIKEFDGGNFKRMYGPYLEIYRKYVKVQIPPLNVKENLTQQMISQKEDLLKAAQELKLFMDRYQQLINTPVFEDFTLVRSDSPIPNLLAWLHAAKLYAALNILDASEGNWEQAVSNLLDHLDFGKRAVKGSRVLITNLIGKAVVRMTIRAIADVMNQKDCPREVFQLVLDRTPPLKYEEYGSKSCFIGEGTLSDNTFDYWAKDFNPIMKFIISLLYQENRVKKVLFQNMETNINAEQTPPFQWEDQDLAERKEYATGAFWWLQNPIGKLMLDEYGLPNLKAVVLKSYIARTIYEMLRISADLHLNYTADKPVKEILESLETYETVDPCSGKPYIWDDEKQLLYSIGTDRVDDAGRQQLGDMTGDFVMPVILYLK